MPIGRITKPVVDALSPGEKELFLWDEEFKGFGVRVTTNGTRSYVLQYRMGGREAPSRRYTIGKHGSPWTPVTARKEAERLAILVHRGIDPVQDKQERQREAVDLAFDSYVKSFVSLYLKKRWKHWQLGSSLLERHAVKALGKKPLPLIKRADLAPIFDNVQDKRATARLVHATLRKLFRWAVSRGDIDRSPLEGVEAPPPVAPRDRVLPDEELALVWKSSGELGWPFAGLFRLLILTGQRRSEVASLDWSELDGAEATWTLPSQRSKNKKPHLVPLTEQAIAILDEFAFEGTWPDKGLVFSVTGKTPISGFSKAKKRLDALVTKARGAELEPWRTHDLRRTVATGLQRLGVRFEVTEAVLNHVSGARGGIAGVYQHHDWAKEKREALTDWAQHVAKLADDR